MDIASLFGALRAAANSLQEMQKKMVTSAPVRTALLDSYDALIVQYCSRNGLQLHKEEVPTVQDTLMYYISTDDFRLGMQIAKDTVEEVWPVFNEESPQVYHPLKLQPEGCPKIAKALRLKDMTEFHDHVKGMQNMYSLTPEKNMRQHLFFCLANLENDLVTVDQQISQWGIAPIEMVKNGPFGLLVPRLEGKPIRAGFFVAPSDLIERDGSLITPEFHVLGARQIGLWASIAVTATSTRAWLPTTRSFQAVYRSEDGVISCHFAPIQECNPQELPGSFVLTLDQPIVITERICEELQAITGFVVRTEDSPSQPYLRLLHEQFFTGKPMSNSSIAYKFVMAGQHHAYSLDAQNEMAKRVSELSFAHPSVVPSVLNALRRQATSNKLLSGCMRNVSENEIINPFAFRLTYASSRSVIVEFSHPLNSSPVKAEIALAENGIPSWRIQQSSPALCTDVSATTWLRKTLSIAVVLRTIIERFVKNYVDEPTKPVTRAAPSRPAQQAQKSLPSIEISPSLILQHVETLTPIQKTAPSITALLESKSTVPPLLSPANQARGNKMEKVLMDKKPASRDKTVSPKSMTMDKSEHTKKLKALYETNEKKQSLKTKRKAESFESELKPKKRKSMVDSASTSLAASSKSSDSSSSLENFAELTKPVASPMGKIRIAKSELSPHGSPITIKLIKRESSDSSMQAVIINKDPPKKKKTRAIDAPEAKKQKKGTQQAEAHLSPEQLRKIKKEAITDAPELVAELKRPKKEVLIDSPFLPEPKPSKTKAEFGILETHLLQSKKGSPNKSPTERKNVTAVPLPNTKVTLIPTRPAGLSTAASSSKKEGLSKPNPHFPSFPSKSPVPPVTSPSKSPVPGMANTSPTIFQLPKTPISSLPRIPKKNASVPSAAAKAVPYPMSPLVSPLGTHATPGQVAQATAQLLDSIFAPSPPLPTTPTTLMHHRVPLLPTPNLEPSSPHSQTPSQFPQSNTLLENINKIIAESTAERHGRPNPGLVIDIPPNVGDPRKSTTGGSAPVETITSPSVKSRNPSKGLNLLALVDRLKQSKSRVDTGPDNSGDSSDVQDGVFKQLTGTSDTTDGKQRTEGSSSSTTGNSEIIEERTSTPTKMAMLVQYDDSTDDDTLDETAPAGPIGRRDDARVKVVSPEIGGPSTFTFRATATVPGGEMGGSAGSDLGKTQPTGAAEIAALTASPPPVDSLINAPDRCSPIILDDELLDAAFLSPETDDKS